MAIMTLHSATGAPGVTTTALGLAWQWGRPVLVVEADLAGSSILTGFLRGEQPPAEGVLALSKATIRSQSWQLSQHTIRLADAVWLLPGAQSPTQAHGMSPAWPQMMSALRAHEATGADVLIDCGRTLHPHADPRAVLWQEADQRVVLTRTRAPEAIAAARLARALVDGEDTSGVGRTSLAVIRHGDYGVREVTGLARAPRCGTLPWSPRTAAVFSDGSRARGRRVSRSVLGVALRQTARTLQARVRDRAEYLHGATP